MRLSPLHLLTLVACLCAPCMGAEPPPAASKQEEPAKKKRPPSWKTVLVPGSVVNGINFPRYEGTRLAAQIHVKKATVINDTELACENIMADLISPTKAITHILADTARYFDDTGRLVAQGSVHIEDPRFIADGDKLHLDTAQHEGYLRGNVVVKLPSITEKKTDKKTP